ncbi:MAG: vgr related protein [Sphingomicrobium sp.]|nr:vgr related protein [Sphingomonadales bacterium]
MSFERVLTPGEIELAGSVFGDAVDYARVRLVKGKWWPFQPRSVVMAPMGKIHFHPDGDTWSDDFSAEPLGAQGLFIHEMTHVWQAQTKGRFFLPLMRHPFCRYAYVLERSRPFDRYGIEQQAEIVRHVFLGERNVVLAQTPPRTLLPFA